MSAHRVGYADVVITAPLAVPYLSHVPRQAPFTSVRDDLHARAMAILDEAGAGALLISVDLIGLGRGLVDDPRELSGVVRAGIAEQTGLAPEGILLSATHSHSTPETTGITTLPRTPEVVSWLTDLVARLVAVGVSAVRDATPATLHVGRVPVDGVAAIRRHRPHDGSVPVCGVSAVGEVPEGTVPSALADLGLSVLVARHEVGPDTVLINFGCHPVALAVQPAVSADYPGALVAGLATDGTRALFLQGACGDVNPIRRHERADDVVRTGAALAVATRRAVAQALVQPPVDGGVSATLAGVEVPMRPRPAAERLAAAEEERRSGDQPAQVAAGTVVDLAERIDRMSDGFTAPVQAIRIGDIAVVGLPGEPFTTLGVTIKATSPARMTFVVGYAGDYAGYLAPRHAWADGGYEVKEGPWSLVSGAGAETLTATAVRMLDELWSPG